MNDKMKILKDVLGRSRKSNQEHLFYCPYCNHHKMKFSVNIDKNVYKCWVCDKRGTDIYQVIRKHGTFSQVQQWRALSGKVEITEFDNLFEEKEKPAEQTIRLPDCFQPIANGVDIRAKSAINYLIKRGVTSEDILRWKIGYCDEGEYKGRIIVPSFGLSGYANFFIARTYNRNWMKYKNPRTNKDIIFNELYLDWDKDIILVEGVFDAIRAHTIGTAIPLVGSTLRENSKLFQALVRHNQRVYVALDDDARAKASTIINKLIDYDIQTYSLDTSGYEDIAEMPRDVLMARKEQADRMSSDNHLFQKLMNL